MAELHRGVGDPVKSDQRKCKLCDPGEEKLLFKAGVLFLTLDQSKPKGNIAEKYRPCRIGDVRGSDQHAGEYR